MSVDQMNIEAVLYAKANDLLEAMRLQEAASFFTLMETSMHKVGRVLGSLGYSKTGERSDHSVKTGEPLNRTIRYEHPDGHVVKFDPGWDSWTHVSGTAKKQGSGVDGLKSHLKNFHKLQEDMLNEADPKPRVERDGNGKPLVPTAGQFRQYFQAMQASHIKDQLKTVHNRWAKAAGEAEKSKDSVFARAELKAIRNEMSIAKSVLAAKERKQNIEKRKSTKKKTARIKQIHRFVRTIAGKNPLINAIATHVADHLLTRHET